MKKTFFMGLAILVVEFLAVSCDTGTGGGGGYAIGDTGPGGGIVFYDKGDTSDGWRYLEAAPASTEWTNKTRGYDGSMLGTTSTSVGSGKANTVAMVAKLTEVGDTGKAAQLCNDLVAGGKDDWFLPSKDELNLMYTNLAAKGLGGFVTTGDDEGPGYISSSETSNRHAWTQHFHDGTQRSGRERSFVRAVRAF
jgi:hypothetical protein